MPCDRSPAQLLQRTVKSYSTPNRHRGAWPSGIGAARRDDSARSDQVGKDRLTLLGLDGAQLGHRASVDGDDDTLAAAGAAHSGGQFGAELTDTDHAYTSVHTANGGEVTGQRRLTP